MATVTAPVEGFSGIVAGVAFDDGVAETRDRAALNYFRRHGYAIDGASLQTASESPDPRDIGTKGDGIEVVGTKLRDAAVDPKPTDFLPPTNAGQANPHGPEVVSPEIHASQGTRPVKPGAVSDSPPAQDVAEATHASQAVGNAPVAPARNASKAAWVEFAIASGGDPDEVGALSRDDLADRYGSTEEA